ncbi:hypothetical protein N7478_002490 [Penicillium angulare]|uniref:uncharacterized protein n=1 Tax=Penicillium angulare TaxID=116970 RepID=UPI0025408D1E|nr:uncharacterized protein N7478_002490 [Penicillium angulare]KAJ5286804.1 hypothetical protein N7478_002490 [Penicillium angulare]
MLYLGALLLSCLHGVVAERLDADLMSFVTLPEVRALKWEVTHHDRERQAPGYWFVAPYGQISPEEATKKYQQYQVGPYIYDNDGILVWAGPTLFDNRNTFDFKANLNIDGDPHLSFIVIWDRENREDKGTGVIVDKHFQVEHTVTPPENMSDFNMHEFNILDGGKTAMACVYHSQEISLADQGRPDETSWVVTGGFAEFDLETNEVLAEWNSADWVSVAESKLFLATDNPAHDSGSAWDYVHANSVDKNEAGDYILSLRYTNTLYGISHDDGSIMWRLGGHGALSDFAQDFTFSKQHDVKFVSSNGTTHVISFLNNAGDERAADETMSSALYVELDTEAMTATVLKRFNRPDNGLTLLRGNTQTLPNGNTFVGWSERGYQSEHAPNGDVLMTAQFASSRYSTYRSYKSEFIGRPNTPPDVVASVYGTSNIDMTTIIHVSWNGATDVAGWNFYAQAYDRGGAVLIGHANKTDFETMYIVDGYMDWIVAEAVDKDGNSMMKSEVTRSDAPANWHSVGFQGANNPSPDDPSLLSAAYDKISSSSSDEHDDSMSDGMDMDHEAASDDSSYANAKEVAQSVYKAYEVIRGVGGLLIFILVSCSIGGVVYGIYRVVKRRKVRSYQHIASDDDLPMEEMDRRSRAD